MNKKGFTLIELLAVIVILAIIALIATPIVLNIIEDSKKSAFVQTGNGIVDAAEYYYMKEMSDGAKPTENKVFTFNGSTTGLEGLEFDGEVPKEGSLTVDVNGNIELVAHNNQYCITKGYNENEISIKDYDGTCEPPKVTYTNGIMTSESNCIKTGNCASGTIVDVKVNNNDTYKFYVLSSTSTDITLIMDQKINSDGTPAGKTKVTQEQNPSSYNTVAWLSKSDYNDDERYGEDGKNNKGPITAMKFLYNATKGWTNVPPLNYEYYDKQFQTQNITSFYNKGYAYESFVSNNGILRITSATEPVTVTEIGTLDEPLRARMIQVSYNDGIMIGEIANFGKVDLSDKTAVPPGPSEYWSLSSSCYIDYAAILVYGLSAEPMMVYSNKYGVVPVITLKI